MDAQALLPAANRVTTTVRFLLLQTGEVRVGLPDHRDRWNRYRLTYDGPLLELAREDTDDVYLVQSGHCTCPAWRFRDGRACKHMDAAAVVRAIHALRP